MTKNPKNKSLLIIGLGYVGLRLAKHFSSEGWAIASTSRKIEKITIRNRKTKPQLNLKKNFSFPVSPHYKSINNKFIHKNDNASLCGRTIKNETYDSSNQEASKNNTK